MRYFPSVREIFIYMFTRRIHAIEKRLNAYIEMRFEWELPHNCFSMRDLELWGSGVNVYIRQWSSISKRKRLALYSHSSYTKTEARTTDHKKKRLPQEGRCGGVEAAGGRRRGGAPGNSEVFLTKNLSISYLSRYLQTLGYQISPKKVKHRQACTCYVK